MMFRDTFNMRAYDISEGNVTFIINCTGVNSAIERYPVIVDTMPPSTPDIIVPGTWFA